MKGLEGRVFIVTGGGSGIGRGACERLASLGARVAVVDLAIENADRVAEALRGDGADAASFACDVSDESSVAGMVSAVAERFGPLQGVINSAGVNLEADRGPIETASADAFERVLSVNLLGTFLVAKHVMPQLLEAGNGSLVNISSVAGIRGGAGQGLGYTASKGGVVSLTQHLAAIYGSRGVRVNCVCPGATAGEGMGAFFRLPEGEAMVGPLVPMNRVGQSEEVGAVAVYLSSEDASYVSGQVLAVDGGATAR